MSQDMIMGIVRHVLTTGGGMLVADGVLTTSQSQDAVGALCVLAGLAWSLYNKYSHKQALVAAAGGQK